MISEQELKIRELLPEMADGAAELICAAMNPDEGAWARLTIKRHFALRAQGLEDGRHYFALLVDGILAGISGLHHYEWGPEENVWLGWFALSPNLQGRGFGVRLMTETERTARSLGYRKLFVETYATPTFARAIRFYTRTGFRQAGMIENYLPDGSAMLVFLKVL
ncbi:MAG: GNAT family N-acetyltransferase [Deltaproteobacteria bacterium]|nr:GNAT family N-acetyltransferase [Deltaproteobacteria bacterium]TLN02790.1 MAG: GNAT family N-acetyltransferase [bacterium]